MKIASAAAVVAALVLTGCTGTGNTPGTPGMSPAGASSSPGAGTASASAGASGVVEPTPPAVVREGAPQAGTVEAAAWEALLGPSGEYASAAAYQAVIDEFGKIEPYVTIEGNEQRHIAALTRQLERRGVDVPDNPYLGAIAAPADLGTAARAWAAGERRNVAMYDTLLGQVEGDAMLTRIFTNLRRSSLDLHLPAFEAAAANGGRLTADQVASLGLENGAGGGPGSGLGGGPGGPNQ